jgi:hypothetical protein
MAFIDGLPPDEIRRDGVMFKLTAKTCKKWADDAHKEAFSDLLSDIASAARQGKYSLLVDKLSDKANELLTADGFMILQQGKKFLISWL